MKYREVLALNTNKPKVHSVYRITDTECWLVKDKHARVGEEYTLTVGSDGNITALGPLIPGTITLADAGGQFRPGNLARWEFVEYRVRHGGEMVGVHLERKRVFQATPKVKSKGVKK
jgi:hypothetical protein